MKKVVSVLILASFALVGCSTVGDGQKAHDKLCTGTKKPYQVQGDWHTPQEHYDYEETGIASWYGPRFHGRPKSCGEIFDMHGVSAAHKTLPIPSVVRVTNVRNGTSVTLLVDDRGPFVKNRIIDLSKGAATHLDLCNRGLGKVHVKCLPEESKAFANFVARYGRYGRDPSGRSWEMIFRQEFDRDHHVFAPKFVKVSKNRNRHVHKSPQMPKKQQSLRRSIIKAEPTEREIDDEIGQLINETRPYLRRG